MQSGSLLEEVLQMTDSSFKYILIVFNFMTLIVVYVHKSKQKPKKEHHVLFVTAHPDDEVMFFRPSIVSISKEYFVHILCLSGKGTEREQELKKSGQNLKVHKVECLNNQKLKDSMQQVWPKDEIQKITLKYIHENNIKAVFTFDSYGVSNHSNHKSIHSALKDLEYPRSQLKVLNKKPADLSQEQKRKADQIKEKTIKIYYLNSVNLIRKYNACLQILFALLRDYCWVNLNIVHAYKSMALHQSQFVWYRKLWVFFSQYSYINFYSMTRINIGPKSNPKSQPQTQTQTQKIFQNQPTSKAIQQLPTQIQLEKTETNELKKVK